MSAKLEKAIANKKVLVRKLASGEILIHFGDPRVKDVVLSGRGVMDLMSKRGVTADVIRKSNLLELVATRKVDIITEEED